MTAPLRLWELRGFSRSRGLFRMRVLARGHAEAISRAPKGYEVMDCLVVAP